MKQTNTSKGKNYITIKHKPKKQKPKKQKKNKEYEELKRNIKKELEELKKEWEKVISFKININTKE